jgi:hypothetical protein
MTYKPLLIMERAGLYLTVFLSGAAVMVIELLGTRRKRFHGQRVKGRLMAGFHSRIVTYCYPARYVAAGVRCD